MNKIIRTILATAPALLVGLGAYAQEVDFDSMSLQDLLNIPTAVTTKTSLSPRLSPGSVTVITSDEIKLMGARDMMDVLHMIPGISFGNDSYGAASVSMRGIWANEGKVLFLWDGLEMNEIMFSSIQLGNRYPVDQIKRVEVIRGPGSAIYGGFAEQAVINVISKGGDDLKGCDAGFQYGQMNHIYGRRNISAQCGKVVDGVNFSVSMFSGQGQRSDNFYTGGDGAGNFQTYRFEDNRLDPNFMNLGISTEKTRFRYIREVYQMTTTSAGGFTNFTRPVWSEFHGQFLGLEHDFKVTDKLKITPVLKYKVQKPWQSVDVELASSPVSNFTAHRLNTGVNAQYDLTEKSNILVGYTRQVDSALNENYGSAWQNYFIRTGGNRIDYYTDSVLAQGLFDLGFATMTVGGRYDKHEVVDGAFSPRFALTKAEDTWHAKLVAGAGFRAPTIMNLDGAYSIDPNLTLKPDKSSTYELEGGYKTSEKTYLTVNVFKTEIKDPITYGVDAGGATRTFNADRLGTAGAELEFRVKDNWGWATATYSHYRTSGANDQTYTVPADGDVLTGFPAHKLTLNSSFSTLIPNIKVSPSVIYMSEYYAHIRDVFGVAGIQRKYELDPLVNLFLMYENFGVKNFDLGVGVFNILDEDWQLAQPYASGNHGPMPTPSREVVVRANYGIEF